MEYKIIFSDIDGTLLDSRHRISPDTKAKIRCLDGLGIPFVLVSARMPAGVKPIRDMLGIQTPMISYSGALIQDGAGAVLYSRQLPKEQAREVRALLLQSFPSICCNAYGGSRWLVDDMENPWVQNEQKITGLTPETGGMERLISENEGIHKLLLMGEADEIRQIEQALRPRYPELEIVRSKDTYLEILDGSVCKSEAVRFLCRHVGCTEAEAVAFGDSPNDLDMLLAVGAGYAMGNGAPEVKAQAGRVTLDNDHEGLLAGLMECF